jgi:serine/threonine protein kinase
VAEALDYAHRRNVIHRGIKPGNIMLHEGTPMVADFGIALAVDRVGGDRTSATVRLRYLARLRKRRRSLSVLNTSTVVESMLDLRTSMLRRKR